MTDEKKRVMIVDMYDRIVRIVSHDFSEDERAIIESPHLGTVQDGGKAFYCEESRYLLSLFLSNYYSTENLDRWNEFKNFLESRLANELNHKKEGQHTTEIISKHWADSWFLNFMKDEERYCEYVIEKEIEE